MRRFIVSTVCLFALSGCQQQKRQEALPPPAANYPAGTNYSPPATQPASVRPNAPVAPPASQSIPPVNHLSPEAEYLALLQQVEVNKYALIAQHTKQSNVENQQMMQAKSRNEDISILLPSIIKSTNNICKEWEDFYWKFLHLPCPKTAISLRDAYAKQLVVIHGVVEELKKALMDSPQESIARMNLLQKITGPQMDATTTTANRELEQFCARFGLQKTFSIQGD